MGPCQLLLSEFTVKGMSKLVLRVFLWNKKRGSIKIGDLKRMKSISLPFPFLCIFLLFLIDLTLNVYSRYNADGHNGR